MGGGRPRAVGLGTWRCLELNIDPGGESSYRLRLAMMYLEDAKAALETHDYRRAVQSSQLCVENSAKAIISLFRVPSWSHNPAPELREVKDNLSEELHARLERLAILAEELAPEHGRSTYGEPEAGLTPWDIYSKEDAERAVSYASEAYSIASYILDVISSGK